MKERGVLIVAFSILLVAFLSTDFTDEDVLSGFTIYSADDYSNCYENLDLLDGKYEVICRNNRLDWDSVKTNYS